jgi:flagellar motor switch protein FliN
MASSTSSPSGSQRGPILQAPEGEADRRGLAAVPPGLVAKVADFAEMTGASAAHPAGSLDRLLDVTVTVAAELGRVSLPISEILKLGTGTVLELDRPVSEPVDLMVQGVRLARGEVVIVDDRFAIRIKEIADPRKRQ